MVPLRLELQADTRPPHRVSDTGSAFLNHLRFTAMACRAKPRADLFEACALLQATRSASLQAHSDALMRCLAQALGAQPKLLAPGTDEITFDESWLLRLGETIAQQDTQSTAFLLASRVLPEHRRLVRFLVGRISASFA
jgi:hypothetical protein